MRNLKSLIPVLFTAFVFTGCNTDDLRNDIDELKNRVESLEAQVSAINENMNALQKLVEGKKTIQECGYNEETKTWTLVLSDGSTLQLYQGEDGVANTPKITIDDTDNTWVVNDVDTNVPATGNDATVPVFSVDAEGYWMVDYDGEGGEAPIRIKDSEGNDVLAKPTDGSETGGDTFFESVKINGDFLEVTLTEDGKTYSLPIVPELLCKINVEGLDDYKNEVLTVGYGKDVKIPVKIKGENYFVTAPSGWIAQLSELSGEDATITLTAPAEPSATIGSRATADNTTDLTLQVNKGAYWAVAKIKVEAKKIISSYYAEWEAGNDIIIGQVGEELGDHIVTINNTIFKTATLVDEDMEITGDGVFFIKPGHTVSFKKGGLKNSILIGDDPNNRTVVTLSSYLPIKDTGNGFIAKNIEFTGTSTFQYIAKTTGSGVLGNFVIDNCVLEIPSAKNLFNIESDNVEISNIALVNSIFKMPTTSDGQATRFINATKALTCDRIFIKNNVFYSSVAGNSVNGNLVYSEKFNLSANITVDNNTFINFIPSSLSMIRAIILGVVDINNNLIYTDYNTSKNATFVNAFAGSNGTYNFSDNIQYNKTEAVINFNHFAGTTPAGNPNTKLVPESTNPFDTAQGATFDMENGVFVPIAAYANYGAKFE